MNLKNKIKRLITLAKSEMKVLDDKDALDVLELYPQWQSGKDYAIGDRVQYDGKLWKVLQVHISQEGWKPDVATSLFTQVTIYADEGTIENPIEYSLNMELIKDKYYIENNVIYLCIQSHPQSVWHLSDLVGTFVQIVK